MEFRSESVQHKLSAVEHEAAEIIRFIGSGDEHNALGGEMQDLLQRYVHALSEEARVLRLMLEQVDTTKEEA